jgi:hypothetical protein
MVVERAWRTAFRRRNVLILVIVAFMASILLTSGAQAHVLWNYGFYSKTIPIDLTTYVGSDYLNAASRAQSAWNSAGVGIAVSHSTYYGNKLFTGLYGYEWYGAYHVSYLGGSTYHQTTGFYIQVNTMLCDALSTYAKQSVVGHELGHAVGLENCSSVALMNTSRNRDSVYYPMWDDRMGAIASWSR